METKTFVLGLLTLIIGSASIFIVMNGPNGAGLLAMNITEFESQFYVNSSGEWVLAGVETSQLGMFNDSLEFIVEGSINNVSYSIDGELFTAYRHAFYTNAIIKETYVYNSSNEQIELFPVIHKIEVINGTGLNYRYVASNLAYSGPDMTNLNGLVQAGYNMSVEWFHQPDSSVLYSNGTLVLDQNVTSDYQVFEIRLFDPITSLSISIPEVDQSYIYYRSPITFSFTNTSNIDKCWYSINNGINNTLLDYECSAKSFTRIFSDYENFNLTLYVNQSDGAVNSTSRNVIIKNIYDYAGSALAAQPTCDLYAMYSYGDSVFSGCNNVGGLNFFKYNMTSKTLTDLSSKVDFSGSTGYIFSISNKNELLFLSGSASRLWVYNMTSNTAINYTSNIITVLGTNRNTFNTYNNFSNIVLVYYQLSNGINKSICQFNLTDATFSDVSSIVNTSISSNKAINQITYDYERNGYWISTTDLNNKFNFYNISSSSLVNITSILSIFSTSYGERFGIDYDNDVIFLQLNSGNYIVRYNILSNTYNNITLDSNILGGVTVGTLTTSGTPVYYAGNNKTYFGSNNGILLQYDGSTNKIYNLKYADLNDISSTTITMSFVNHNGYTFIGTGDAKIMIVGDYLNNTNNLTSKVIHNNSYSNSVDPIGLQIYDTSPISDCWYNIDGGANVSIKLYGCNLTTAINNFVYKFNLTHNQKYNFTMYTNNSVNNLSILRKENITMRNMYNLRQATPYNWQINNPNDVEIDQYGNVWGVFGTGIITYYDPEKDATIDVSQKDITGFIQGQTIYGLYYDKIHDLMWVSGMNRQLAYYNYSDGLLYNASNFTFLTVSIQRVEGMAIDENQPEFLYMGFSNGQFRRFNITSGVIDNLTDTDVGNWISTNSIVDLQWYNYSGKSLIFMGTSGSTIANNFGYYNTSSNITTNLTKFVGASPFLFPDLSISGFWIGAAGARIGTYNVTSGVFVNLTPSAQDGFLSATAQKRPCRIGNEVYWIGSGTVGLGRGMFYNILENKTYSLYSTTYFPYTLTQFSYSVCDEIRNRVYFFGGSGVFAYLENITQPLVVPKIQGSIFNASFYSLNAPITINIRGREVDKCSYVINSGSSVPFICNNEVDINITPVRQIGTNTLTITVNDSSGNSFSQTKKFKSFNFSVINSSVINNALYSTTFDSSINSLYQFGLNGNFGRVNLTNNVFTDLSSTDTGNWLGTKVVYSSCKGKNGLIYFVGDLVAFGQYNFTSNEATNISAAIQPIVPSGTINKVKCSSDGDVFLISASSKIARYYPQNNTAVNYSLTVNIGATTAITYLEAQKLLFFTVGANNTYNEVTGYINMTSGVTTFLNGTYSKKPTDATSTAGQFYNIVDNDIDKVWFGGYGVVYSYNVTSNTFEDLTLGINNGILSNGKYVLDKDGMYYDNLTGRVYFSTLLGVISYINTTSNVAHSFTQPFYPNQLSYPISYFVINSINDLMVFQGYQNPPANRDLMVVNSTQIFDVIADVGPTDSCTYVSGNHIYQCSDGCNLTPAINYGGNNVTFNGTGQIQITGNLTNYNRAIAELGCQVFVKSGGRLI